MNKKIITALIAAGLLSTSLISCTTEKNPSGNDVTANPGTDSESSSTLAASEAHYNLVTRDNPYTVYNQDKTTTYISNNIKSASFVAYDRSNSPAAKKMNERLDEAYSRNETSSTEMTDILDNLFADTEADIDAFIFPWTLETDYELVRNDGKAISVIEHIDHYTGGANHALSTFTYNFDPATGEQISQVFYDESLGKEEYDKADDVLYKKLMAKYPDSEISYTYISSSFVDTASDSWYFTEDGIKVIFNVYDIAPAAAGTFELDIPKEELPDFAQKYFN